MRVGRVPFLRSTEPSYSHAVSPDRLQALDGALACHGRCEALPACACHLDALAGHRAATMAWPSLSRRDGRVSLAPRRCEESRRCVGAKRWVQCSARVPRGGASKADGMGSKGSHKQSQHGVPRHGGRLRRHGRDGHSRLGPTSIPST